MSAHEYQKLVGSEQVIIVGAGPGGAVLSYLLAKAGVRVTLIERHQDFSREFRGEILMPGGLEPLDQIGLWEDLEKVSHVKLDGINIYVDQKRAWSLEFTDSAYSRYRPRWISQPHFLEMLVEKSALYSNFRLLRGTRVRDLIWDNNRVTGVITDDKDSANRLFGDLIIGTDGRSSIVRARSGISYKSDAMPMDIVWVKIPRGELRLNKALRAYIGGGRLLICAPTYDDHIQLGFVIKKGSFRELRNMGISHLMDLIAEHADPIMESHLHLIRETAPKPFLLSTVSDRVDRWSLPGLLLLGDAAHTISPVGGQGLNLAIRDSIVAANHLIPALLSGANATLLDEASLSIEKERIKEIVTIQKLQARPPKILLRNTWWTKILFGIISAFGKGRTIALPSDGIFGKMAWGVSEVKWLGFDSKEQKP